jgi:hypothetical protein
MPLIDIGDYRLSEDEVRDLLATDHPMVEEFRFVKQHERPGQSLSFALVIEPKKGVRYQQQRDARGERIDPVWRTLTGHEDIGQGNRGMHLQGGEIVAENHTFFPNQEFNDLGIGSALYVSMERMYRALGIRRVSLLAVDVGVYVWARQAFQFQEPGTLGQCTAGLERLVRHNDRSDSIRRADFRHSWDVANFDVSGLLIDEYRVGKYFMLGEAPSWYGLKRLDDSAHNAVAEASRRETFARLPSKIEGAPGELEVR